MNSPTTLIAHPDIVRLGLQAKTGEDAIRELHTELAATPGAVSDPPLLLADLLERTRLSSVYLTDDIALPHARTAAVDRLVLAVGRAVPGVSFDAEHREIRLIFLVGTPKQAVSEYLQMVAGISRILRNPRARATLLSCDDEFEFRGLLADAMPS